MKKLVIGMVVSMGMVLVGFSSAQADYCDTYYSEPYVSTTYYSYSSPVYTYSRPVYTTYSSRCTDSYDTTDVVYYDAAPVTYSRRVYYY